MLIDSRIRLAQTQSMKNITVLKLVVYMALVWTAALFWSQYYHVSGLLAAPPLFSATDRNNAGQRSK